MSNNEPNREQIRCSKNKYRIAVFPTDGSTDEKFSLLPALTGAVIGITAKWLTQKKWFNDNPSKKEAMFTNLLRKTILKVSGVCLKFKNKKLA